MKELFSAKSFVRTADRDLRSFYKMDPASRCERNPNFGSSVQKMVSGFIYARAV